MATAQHGMGTQRFGRMAAAVALFLGMLLLNVTSTFAQAPFQVYPQQMTVTTGVGDPRTSAIFVYNYTNADMTLDISLTGADASYFQVDRQVTIMDQPGDSVTSNSFSLVFTPDLQRSYVAQVNVTDGSTTRSLYVIGYGTMPQPIIYGNTNFLTDYGTTACEELTIANQTNLPITLTSLELQTGEEFAFGDPALTFPILLQPGETLPFGICFTPSRSTIFIDSLLLGFQTGGFSGTAVRGLYGVGNIPVLSCAWVDGDSTFGPVGADETVLKTYTIFNSSGRTLEINAGLNGDPHFKILSPSFPITLATGESKQVEVKFYSGNDNMKQAFQTVLYINGKDSADRVCSNGRQIYAWASYRDQPVDSTYYNLTGDEKEKLDIDGEAGDTYRIFKFINTTTSNMTVKKVEMKKGEDFSARVLFNPPDEELPIVLSPQEVMLVRIDLTNPEPGDYKDDLLIEVENAITMIEFAVEGTVGAANVAERNATVAHLAISENPARGAVCMTVADAREARIEIIDIMGRVIATNDGLTFNWNAATSEASQSYIVRASGIDENGLPYILSERLQVIR
jgi:hypothetical protein